MIDTKLSWQGSTKIVDVSQARLWAPWFVAEYRLRNMSKWFGAIVAFGLGNPVLYLLSVGIGIGALVDNVSGGENSLGVPYLTFLAPALLATAAIQSAMDETTFPTMQGFLWDKSFFSMIATQLMGRDIVGGIMIASSIRCIFNTITYGLVLVLFGAIGIESLFVLVVAAIFAGISFAAVMLAVTSFVKQDDGFYAIVGRFVIAPMFMFSGTFYPLDSLPIYLQWIGWISPVWHATNLGRNLSYGLEVEPWLLAVHVLFLGALLVASMIVATKKFNARLSA
ncbi:MAG: ABC transporter permease [Rhodoluna sp.]|nr:ABC transporter permease [Rhodoluna sp.]